MINKIKNWFFTKKKLIFKVNLLEEMNANIVIYTEELQRASGCPQGMHLIIYLKQMREDLIYKVSQERAAEILGIKNFEDVDKQLGAEAYKAYLEEAELIYKTRPWRDIIKKFQYDQVQYIMTKSDGGSIGLLQQLVSRGALLFSDHAEKELKLLHIRYLDIKTGTIPLNEEEKYKIFQ